MGPFRRGLIVREAKTSDISAIFSIFTATQDWHSSHYPTLFRENVDMNKFSELMTAVIKNDTNFLWVASQKNKIIGYLFASLETDAGSFFTNGSRQIAIQQICIVSEYQKNGVGRSLMEKAISKAKKEKATEIYLDSFENNLNAQKAFKRMGFTPQRTRFSRTL